MAGDQSPQRNGRPDGNESGAGQGWVAMSYLISGIAVWGFIGWLVDRWLGLGGVAIAIGSLVGAAGGFYLILRRLGSP